MKISNLLIFIFSKLNSLDIELQCNDRILGNLANSIRELKNEIRK